MADVLNISRGKIAKAQKVIIYGPEGIGKSTFLSKFPGVIFIDTEGSTAHMDVLRTDRPTSWAMLISQVTALKDHPPQGFEFKTLAIDTADWAEKLCIASTCAKYKVSGIEDFGYGKGYTYNAEEFGRLLNLLQDLVDKGINVAISAHAMMRKFEQPDEMGAYDRWELKCDKRISAMLKEWADMVLFANYETYVISPDNKMEKKKVTGGKRVMHTTHHACWDAKNRFGLADKVEFGFDSIAGFIPGTPEYAAQSTSPGKPSVEMHYPENCTAQELKCALNKLHESVAKQQENDVQFYDTDDIPDYVPKSLADLMRIHKITLAEIQHAVTARGYYPEGTAFTAYDPEFIQAVLVAAWGGVKGIIFELREKEGNSHEY